MNFIFNLIALSNRMPPPKFLHTSQCVPDFDRPPDECVKRILNPFSGFGGSLALLPRELLHATLFAPFSIIWLSSIIISFFSSINNDAPKSTDSKILQWLHTNVSYDDPRGENELLPSIIYIFAPLFPIAFLLVFVHILIYEQLEKIQLFKRFFKWFDENDLPLVLLALGISSLLPLTPLFIILSPLSKRCVNFFTRLIFIPDALLARRHFKISDQQRRDFLVGADFANLIAKSEIFTARISSKALNDGVVSCPPGSASAGFFHRMLRNNIENRKDPKEIKPSERKISASALFFSEDERTALRSISTKFDASDFPEDFHEELVDCFLLYLTACDSYEALGTRLGQKLYPPPFLGIIQDGIFERFGSHYTFTDEEDVPVNFEGLTSFFSQSDSLLVSGIAARLYATGRENLVKNIEAARSYPSFSIMKGSILEKILYLHEEQQAIIQSGSTSLSLGNPNPPKRRRI